MATYQVKTKSGVYQVTTKAPAQQPTTGGGYSVDPIQIAKQSAANLVGPGLRNYVPGLEQPAVKSGIDASQQIEKKISEKIDIPKVPLKGIGNVAGPIGIAAEAKFGTPNLEQVVDTAFSGSLDPRFVASGFGGGKKPAESALKSYASRLERKSAEKLGKAEDIFTRISDIPKGTIATARERGTKIPGVEYGTKEVKKSKTVGELFDTIVGRKREAGAEKASVIESLPQNDAPRAYLRDAIGYINELRAKGIHSEKEIDNLTELIDREIKFLNDTPISAQDPAFFDSRKQVFQREASPLYEKIQRGTASGLEREAYSLYSKLASGYKKFL